VKRNSAPLIPEGAVGSFTVQALALPNFWYFAEVVESTRVVPIPSMP
jgi:hypothetical protein